MEQNQQESRESDEEVLAFRELIYRFYRNQGRTFPWRETNDPWLILLSEMMLQQTQTSRVASRWETFVAEYPTPAAMDAAGLDQVLRSWSGLGYNRRAVALKKIARSIVKAGRFPDSYDELLALPMIGTYTAKAVLAFAWQRPVVLIETNIRRVFLHHFFRDQQGVADRSLLPWIEKSLDHNDPKSWYYALMDYGADLKGKVENPNRRSAHYTVQAPFKGSVREKRGKLIKLLSGAGMKGSFSLEEIVLQSGINEESCKKILHTLQKEEFVAEEEGSYSIRR